MGEYVYTTITIRGQDLERFCEIVDVEDFEDRWPSGRGQTLVAFATQANYGNFDFEDELQEALIPYDKTYDSGAEWLEGEDFYRPDTGVREFCAQNERILKADFVETLCKIRDRSLLMENVIATLTEEIHVTPLEDWVAPLVEASGDV